MTTGNWFARSADDVKQELLAKFECAIDGFLAEAETEASPHELESALWEKLLPAGCATLAYGFAFRCRKAAEADISSRGLSQEDVRFRGDESYRFDLMTTFGPVSFPVFAYRDTSSGLASVTRAPAREALFPFYRRCRSSQLCLEWELRLGSDQPFRRAEQSLLFFSHGVATREDTTIARHTVEIGKVIDPKWLYRPPKEIAHILANRATRDRRTGQPIIYASLDAHALRRYVDETWDASWKMANGIRLWCVDRYNDKIIHLGGEYTWGDCHDVKRIMERLIACGHLPADGVYPDGTQARVVFVTDGMPWFQDHVFPLFLTAVFILDVYHVMERLAKYAAVRFGKGTKHAKGFYDRALRLLLGERATKKPKKSSVRKGHTKRRRVDSVPEDGPAFEGANLGGAEELLDLLQQAKRVPKRAAEEHQKLIDYIGANLPRMDYQAYRALGFQIGSGAMESLHRTGSQARLKLPGASWLQETSQAIFNIRMMILAERWTEFWHQPDLHSLLAAAFPQPHAAPANDVAKPAEKAA